MTTSEFETVTLTTDEFIAILKQMTNDLPVVGEVDLFGEVTTQANRDLALERLGSFASGVIGRVEK